MERLLQIVQINPMIKTTLLALGLASLCITTAHGNPTQDSLIKSIEGSDNPAVKPTPRFERWIKTVEKQNKIMQAKQWDVVLIGDSITHGWKKHKDKLKLAFGNKKVMNLGHPADKTENMIWRMLQYDFSKIKPAVTVIMAGTNNSNEEGSKLGYYSNEQIIDGVKTLVNLTQAKLPDTHLILCAILPRGDSKQRRELKSGRTKAEMNPQWARIKEINKAIKAFANENNIYFLEMDKNFLDENGDLLTTAMPDLLHPNAQGYDIWANSIMPHLSSLDSRQSGNDK